MSNAYLVDVGVVVDKDEYPTCYSKVYDKARGYYDEDRYLVDDLEKAKKEALRYVADGVDKTYPLRKENGLEESRFRKLTTKKATHNIIWWAAFLERVCCFSRLFLLQFAAK